MVNIWLIYGDYGQIMVNMLVQLWKNTLRIGPGAVLFVLTEFPGEILWDSAWHGPFQCVKIRKSKGKNGFAVLPKNISLFHTWILLKHHMNHMISKYIKWPQNSVISLAPFCFFRQAEQGDDDKEIVVVLPDLSTASRRRRIMDIEKKIPRTKCATKNGKCARKCKDMYRHISKYPIYNIIYIYIYKYRNIQNFLEISKRFKKTHRLGPLMLTLMSKAAYEQCPRPLVPKATGWFREGFLSPWISRSSPASSDNTHHSTMISSLNPHIWAYFLVNISRSGDHAIPTMVI